MKAMVITRFGGPEVFEARDTPQPDPGCGELLVRVKATALNPVDYKVRQNGEWAGIRPPAVLGYDVSGVVEATGPGSSVFRVGDEVYYTPDPLGGRGGSYAEFNVVPEEFVALKPANLTHVQAASLPLAGCTAWDALVDRANLTVGESVLIHGAGGVGALALQIARAAGAQVFATSSPQMIERLNELRPEHRAHRLIGYNSEDFAKVVLDETGGLGVDVVVDTVGGDLLARSIPVVKSFGRMVGIVESIHGSLNDAFIKNITLYMMFLQRARYKLDALRWMVEGGQIEPVIDSVRALESVGEAHRLLEQGGLRGKIVLKVAD